MSKTVIIATICAFMLLSGCNAPMIIQHPGIVAPDCGLLFCTRAAMERYAAQGVYVDVEHAGRAERDVNPDDLKLAAISVDEWNNEFLHNYIKAEAKYLGHYIKIRGQVVAIQIIDAYRHRNIERSARIILAEPGNDIYSHRIAALVQPRYWHEIEKINRGDIIAVVGIAHRNTDYFHDDNSSFRARERSEFDNGSPEIKGNYPMVLRARLVPH